MASIAATHFRHEGSDFMPELKVGQCPLLTKHAPAEAMDLVQSFNRVNKLGKLAGEVSLDQERLAELQRRLESMRGQLKRNRYRVGLMGPFQIGKSTAFNKAIGAENRADQVATEGGGAATTAAITRLYPTRDGQRKLRVNYLTDAQFQEKLNYLRAITNLKNEKSVADLLRAAAKKYEKCMAGELERIENDLNSMEHVREIDIKYLGLLLHSCEAYRAKVLQAKETDEGDISQGEPGDFDQRHKYLNHPDNFNKASYSWAHLQATIPPVVATVDVYYPTDVLPEDLVIIDTPGLGSMGRIDEWLLAQYIPRLDGAIVVPDAARPADELTKKILQKLQERFPKDFGERVWVVAARSDTIGPEFAAHQTAGFNSYRALAEDLRVDLSHVSFFTKYPEVPQGRFGTEPPDELRKPGFEPLATAWREMLADGGVQRLRRIMQSDLAVQIGASLVRDCRRDLADLQRVYEALIEQAINDANVDEDLEGRVRDARLKIRAAAIEVRIGNELLMSATHELQQALEKSVTLLPESLLNSPMDEAFEDHAQLLERALHTFTRQQFVTMAYDEVRGSKLDPLESERMLIIPTDFHEGLAYAWNAWRDEDRDNATWLGNHFPSFLRNSPFSELAQDHVNPYTVDDYIDLMKVKIRTVAQQVAQIFRQRLSHRLQSIERLLTAYLERDRAEIDSARAKEIRRRMHDC